MIEVVLFSIVLFSGFALLINYSFFKQTKNIYCQKVYFLNRELSQANNVNQYILKKQFSFDADRFSDISEPDVYDDFLVNHFYKSAIEDYQVKKKIFKVLGLIFGIFLVVSVVVLLSLYPEFIKDVFEEDSYG